MRAGRALRAGVGRALAAGLLALAASGASGRAAEAEAVSPDGRFRVSDAMIPMRDGVRLHTKIFTPKEADRAAADHPAAHALRRRGRRRQLQVAT